MDFWKMINWLFPTRPRVITRTDNSTHPCGYSVAMTIPDDSFPPQEEIICVLPDGVDEKKARRAQLLAAVPEMVDRLGDHCDWCADCDWMNNPDQECSFGQLWKKLRGER